MADTLIKNITSGYNVTKINDNFQNVKTKLDGPVLSSSDGQNTMYQDFDLNSNNLLNVNILNVQGLTIGGEAVSPTSLGSLGPNTVATANIIDGSVTDNKIVSVSSGKSQFQQNGVGAIIRDVQNRLRETIHISDFGATPESDAGALIQAAIDSVSSSSGAEILIPAGTYTIEQKILVNKYGVTIRGVGSQAGELSPSINQKGVILKQKSGSNLDAVLEIIEGGCRLENINVDGNGAAQTGGLGRGIMIYNPNTTLPQLSFTRLDHVGITGTYGQGIWCGVAPGGVTDRIVMIDVQVRDTYGTSLEMHNCFDSYFYGLNLGGVFNVGSYNMLLDNCRRLGFMGGIGDFCGNGIAAYVFQCQEVNFVGFQVEEAGKDGFYVEGGSGIFFNNCQARNCGALGDQEYYGINLVNGCDNVVIQGFRGFDVRTPTKKQSYGICVSTTGRANIIGCDNTGNNIGGIKLNNGVNKVLMGNTPNDVPVNVSADYMTGGGAAQSLFKGSALFQNAAGTGWVSAVTRDGADRISLANANTNSDGLVIWSGGTNKILQAGAADSGGTGFRLLRVVN